MILLPQTPKCWDYRRSPPHPANSPNVQLRLYPGEGAQERGWSVSQVSVHSGYWQPPSLLHSDSPGAEGCGWEPGFCWRVTGELEGRGVEEEGGLPPRVTSHDQGLPMAGQAPPGQKSSGH
jgi:hypothetical protein